MEQNLKNKPVFALSVAAELLTVHPRTLMFYEKENLIKPTRTKTGRRLFSQADLSLLQFIRYLTEKKRINTAGVKVVLELLKKVKSTNPKLKQEFFYDFEEKELI
jgi:MerR family transcriptional regulator/heat shock protein HspR